MPGEELRAVQERKLLGAVRYLYELSPLYRSGTQSARHRGAVQKEALERARSRGSRAPWSTSVQQAAAVASYDTAM